MIPTLGDHTVFLGSILCQDISARSLVICCSLPRAPSHTPGTPENHGQDCQVGKLSEDYEQKG